MIPPLVIKIVFYIGVILSLSLHVVYLNTVLKYHKQIITSLERANLCKAHQIEGETVRFAVLKLYNRDLNYYKRLTIIISSIISVCIIGAFVYIRYQKSRKSEIYMVSPSPTSDVFSDIAVYIGVCAIIIAWIDTALIYMVFNDIEKTSKSYKKDVDFIVSVLKMINTEYPMYGSTSEKTYPKVVLDFYNLILQRWVNKNNESTLEDGKISLIRLAENNEFDVIFQYIKFDITHTDHSLLTEIYNRTEFDTKRPVDDIKIVLSRLQTYKPSSEYMNYRERLKKYMIYGIIITAPFVLPLFHILYNGIGPGIVGIFFILVIIALATWGYYTYLL